MSPAVMWLRISLLMLVSHSVFANVISYEFSGDGVRVNESDFTFGASEPLASFEGNFSFEDELNIEQSGSDNITYGSNMEASITFDDAYTTTFSGGLILVANDQLFGGVVSDYVVFYFDTTESSDLNIGQERSTLSLTFLDDTASALSDVTSPTEIDLNDFSAQWFFWRNFEAVTHLGGDTYRLHEFAMSDGYFNSLSSVAVPEPKSFTLMLLGVLLLGRLYRNKPKPQERFKHLTLP